VKVLIQVESPYFTAGIVLTDDKVTQMAPILSPALPRPARLGAGLIARPMRVVRMSHVVQAAGR